MPNISLEHFVCCERRDVSCSHSNRDLFTCEDNMLFSHVKISCFRAEAHLVFHWYLYNKNSYFCHDCYYAIWSSLSAWAWAAYGLHSLCRGVPPHPYTTAMASNLLISLVMLFLNEVILYYTGSLYRAEPSTYTNYTHFLKQPNENLTAPKERTIQ